MEADASVAAAEVERARLADEEAAAEIELARE
jgi:hypothetical protein